MKQFSPLALAICLLFALSCSEQRPPQTGGEAFLYEPNDHFALKRAYPDKAFDFMAYARALEEAQRSLAFRSSFPGFEEEWIVRGPGNIGARANAVAFHPQDENIIYAGFARGGVWKTTDGGQNWIPIFDGQIFLAIGDIEIDPTNPDVVYVGTGDPNITGYPGIGNGVYKSTDGGQNWQHLGLEEQRIISHIRINPLNPNIVYAAAMGLPFERNNQRGLYRSLDGGQSWEQVLFISNQAGVIDLAMHPANPDILYAAGWDRVRNNQESTISGPGAKIYKTTDGGDTWTLLQGGLPQENIGRIGLAIAPSNPDIVYALYVGNNSQLFNVYRTDNGGQSWAPVVNFNPPQGLDDGVLGGFGWFFGKVRVNPADPNDFFVLGVDLWRTRDGGQSWEQATPPWYFYEVHADKHDLMFTPSGDILLATDGGLYRSGNDGLDWEDIENIPTTQFYRVAYNPHLPDLYYGGAQDNGTTGGPSLAEEWPRIYGGDGFQVAFRPDRPEVMYAETQNGGIVASFDGGFSFNDATDGIDPGDRRDWDMQYIISPHNPDVLYTGTFRAYRSTSGVFPDWAPISGDLTDGVILHPRYHAITAIDESPVVEGLLYVGTVDANVWRSDNAGGGWADIKTGLPERYVTSVKASPAFADWVYVTHSGYKDNEFIPRIHRSKDWGANWEDISGDLPDLAINDVYILPGHQDSVLFVATDGGVYGSMDSGQGWERLGVNMPYVQAFDLEWNQERNELVVGTFARSILSYPLDSLFSMPQDTTLTSDPAPSFASEGFIKVYPSPATDWVRVGFQNIEAGREYSLAILSQSGQVVMMKRGKQQGYVEEQMNVSALPVGMYVAKVKMRHTVRTGRFLKK
ncbi:MAG: T9SS type A sorting domain-containing protein [Phaeodactylibacter sp.]|nr:T9SS type A sorting domain-containing protein [Phaeodactylibacter sp.]